MDRAWMKARLNACLELRVEIENAVDNLEREEAWYKLARYEVTAKEIFKRLDPATEYLETESDYNGEFVPLSRINLERALGILEDQQEWSVRLAPDSPVLSAAQLHPWVWEPAQPFWNSCHYRAAVHTAAVALNANTQSKVGRTDVFDDDLMNQVLSADLPKPGKPRLRLPGDPTADKTLASRQRALLPFAQGCFAGIRNLAAHEHGPDWDEQRALQSLACLSILAGWISECAVITAEPATTPPDPRPQGTTD